ncbi:MAG: hypothetical protein H6R04_1731 [Burkholderiaceae bacterium]|nr:hypothetical protein [Burkholderiaceae bacterium]
MKITQERALTAGQNFVVDAFRPEDAPGVANLFLAVYGPSYPFDLYYYPEKIVEACQKRDLYLVVCRTAVGDIIACGAIYRSAPPNWNLFEFGLYMVAANYRTTKAAFRMTKYMSGELITTSGLDGLFGEAVTNHTASQKVSWLMGAKETAIELSLTPESMYTKELSASRRVTCVMSFRIDHDQPQTLYLPPVYADILPPIIARTGLVRSLQPAATISNAAGESQLDSIIIPDTGVLRVNVAAIGADFGERLAAAETEADGWQPAVRQWFLKLTDPAIGDAVAQLRNRGYFLGGYLPHWFGDDGLLMQKLHEAPDFEAIQIYSDEAISLLETAKADYRQVCGK